MNREASEFKRAREGAWVIFWRWGMAILGLALSGIAINASMWLKLNAPTRIEFNELSHVVQSLREDLIRREVQQTQIIDHEKRLDKLEDETRRRFPVKPTP